MDVQTNKTNQKFHLDYALHVGTHLKHKTVLFLRCVSVHYFKKKFIVYRELISHMHSLIG